MNRERLDRLTALRWVAALLVFLVHINLEVLHVDKLGRLSNPGVSGVDFFFVLSGFVLAWSYRPGDSARAFYRRRVARIVPLYLLAWLAGLLVSTLVYGEGIAVQLPSLFFVQTWVPRSDIIFAGAIVLWSLSCEAFFYLLFPILIGPIARAGTTTLKRLAVSVVVVALAIPLVLRPSGLDRPDAGWREWLVYPFPPTRLCEFLLGAVAALLVRRNALPKISLPGALLLATAAYLAAGWAPEYLLPVALTVVPYTLVIVAAAQGDIAGRGKPPRWLIRLGEWSYAFFLFQVVIMRVVVRAVAGTREPGLGTRIGLAVLLLVLCTAVAAVLCELVEKPLERRLRGDGSLPVSMTEPPDEAPAGSRRASPRDARPSRSRRGLLSSSRHR